MNTPTKLTEEQIKSNIEAYEAWLRNKNIELQYMRIGQTEWINWITNETFSQDHGIIAIRIKPQPKLRPWKAEEIPLDAWYREKKHTNDWFKIVYRWVSSNSTKSNEQNIFLDFSDGESKQITTSKLLENCEHSLNGGKTWNPCGVIE